MFRRRTEDPTSAAPPVPMDRVSSVLGADTSVRGQLSGAGGVRIEGAFEGDIDLHGLLVIGEGGRVTCEHLQAGVVVIAGVVKGNITAEKVEIRATGRVWGDVVTTAFATEEGAFLRGKITMEEELDLFQEEEIEVEAADAEVADAEVADADAAEADAADAEVAEADAADADAAEAEAVEAEAGDDEEDEPEAEQATG